LIGTSIIVIAGLLLIIWGALATGALPAIGIIVGTMILCALYGYVTS
jgi:hypothetical protein